MGALELDFGSDFLDHSTRASGSGFLKNWKEDGRIVVWNHPHAPIYSLWSHNFFRYSEEKDRDTKEVTTVIRNMRVNCIESEAILKKQRWRNDDDTREMPPTICPHCLMVEWIRAEVHAGNLEWSTPVFRLELDDEEQVLYAGGICGLFQKKTLTAAEKTQVRKTGVKLNEAYMQNGFARQQYVFAVASDADTEGGWVIAIEGQTLGDKLKKCIRDEIKRCGGDVEQGHPRFNPYPFEWNFDDNKEFSEKYDVVALSRQRPSDRIRKLLEASETEMPNFDRLVAEPKFGTMKQLMQNAALIEMPFDDFFAGAFEKFGEEFEKEEVEAEEEEKPKTRSTSKPATTSSKPAATTTKPAATTTKAKPKPEPEPEPEEDPDMPPEDDEMIGCDVCGMAMGKEDMTCGECGATYAEGDDGNVRLATRKCGNEDCMETAVPVNDAGGGKCPQCGAVHKEDWTFKLPEKKATQPARRSGGPATHTDATASRRSKARAALSK